MTSVSIAKLDLRPMTTFSALTTFAAINAPSITANGLARMMDRSLNEPGSPSAPLTTTVVGVAAPVP